MKLIITGRHVEVSKTIQQYIRKRFGKWATFLESDAEVHVIVSVEGYRHQVEVTAKGGRYSVNAKQITKDMYSAIDLIAEKIGHQLVRQHEKNVRKTGGVTGRKLLAAGEKSPGEKPAAGRIADIEPVSGKPMTREEAVLQLQGSKQPFMVFEDVESGQLQVLVRKRDGNFKLIVRD